MRSMPSCWNRTLAKLGFRRRIAKKPRQRQWRRFGLVETLEPRQLLSISVNTLADTVDGDAQVTSLREAIAAANATSGETIEFDPTLVGGTISLGSPLNVTSAMTIAGPGAGKMTVSGAGAVRVFNIDVGGSQISVGLSGLAIADGFHPIQGGGIYSTEALALNDVHVIGNHAAAIGGGLYQIGGTLSVVDSVFSDNKAPYAGGALVQGTTATEFSRSSIIHNVAYDTPADPTDGGGGGLYLSQISQANAVQIKNSTISSNVAEREAGGLVLGSAYATITNSTITLNEAKLNYSGAVNYGGGLTLYNTIVAGNIGAADLSLAVLSGTGNLFASGFTGAAGLGKNLLVGQTTGLSSLGLHGGKTPTHVPLPTSPAIDAGSSAQGATLTVDQRGFRRSVDRPEATSAVIDVGAVELSPEYVVIDQPARSADFNGDGRRDFLLVDLPTRSITVLASSTVAGGLEPQYWGTLPDLAGAPDYSFTAGDFNGDGRDDLLVRAGNAFHVAISDGNSFIVHAGVGLAGSNFWQDLLAGDLDGDGSDEILVWNSDPASQGWRVVEYSEQTRGLLLNGTWYAGTGLFREASATRFLGDANRDGRADLIRLTTGGQWGVALSQPLTASAASGALVHQPGWAPTWFDSHYSGGKLDADGPIRAIIDTFEEVYNNVELELYPGLMKGPQATQQTKAGNAWDQAALLEQELAAIGVSASIATGQVTVAAADVARWLGVDNPTPASAAAAAVNILRLTVDSNATHSQVSGTITFRHAWVRVTVPLGNGFQTVDLDPSWKFKDRQTGLSLLESADLLDVNGPALPHPSVGLFDEFEYLTLDPAVDGRLPLEFFEDQVAQYLATAHPGMSLAEIGHDGPILAKSFAAIPVGAAGSVTATNPTVVDLRTFDSMAALLSAPADSDTKTPREKFTHRVKLELLKGSDVHWSDELVVAEHSLDAINITFGSSFANAISNVDSLAPATASQFFGRLVVDGELRKGPLNNAKWFGPSDTAILELTHFAPTMLVPASTPPSAGPATSDRKLTFTEKPGEIISVALDANQHSRDSVAALQSKLLAAVAIHTTESALLPDIDLLTSYAAARYWFDFNGANRSISQATRTIGGQQWVGSGIVKADPVLLSDPTPEGSDDVVVEYLPYGIAPRNFGVDLPNINHFTGRTDTGLLNAEAWQLMGYNSSALEHNIVEQVISSPSISTMKGLQRAAQRDLAFTGAGTAMTDDVIMVFEAVRTPGTTTWTPSFKHVWFQHTDDTSRVNNTGAKVINSESDLNSSLVGFEGLLWNHNSTTNLGHTLWQFFSSLSSNEELMAGSTSPNVTVLVPRGRTTLYDASTDGSIPSYLQNPNGWVGGVYVAQIPGLSASFIIDEHGPTSGGFGSNVTTAPPIQLKPGSFANFTSAGDPVNVANGNMYRDETDIVFPNLGVPLTFSRHYDAQSKDDFGMGAGWMYSFGDLIYTETNGDRVWVDSGGQRHVFKISGSTFIVPESLRGDLTFTSGAAAGAVDFVFKSRDGMEYRFEKTSLTQSGKSVVGRLNSIVDRNDDGIVVEYQPGSNRTIKHVRDTHSTGATPDRRLAFNYLSGGVIGSVSKYAGGLQGTWDFTYFDMTVPGFPSTKRLTASQAPAVAVLDPSYAQSTSRPTVTYSYVGPTHPYLGKGLIQQITEPDGAWHGYEYYANGRVFRVRQGNPGQPTNTPAEDQIFDYNILRNATQFTDERGNVETYLHQDNGQLKTQIHPDRTRLHYGWGATGSADEFRLQSTTDERGTIETFTYYGASDPAFKRGQLKTSTAKRFPAATPITTAYDYFNPANKPHIAALASVTVDSPAAADDAPNNPQYAGKKLVTTYAYDADGRRTLTVDPLGNQVAETYYGPNELVLHQRGLLRSIVDGRRHSRSNLNDGDNSAVAWRILGTHPVTAENGALTVTTPLTGHDGWVSLDAVRIDRLDGDGNVVETRIIDDDLAGMSSGFSLVGVSGAALPPTDTWSARYAGDALIVPYTGQTAGALARWEFVGLQAGNYRVSATWMGWDDTPGRSSNVEYKVAGGWTSFPVNQHETPDTGTLGIHWFDEYETTFEYDAAGNVTNTRTGDKHFSGNATYNALGQVVHRADATNVYTESVYDALGRLKETGFGDSNAATIDPLDQFATTYKYDAFGRVRESVDPLGRVTKFEYDGRGRLLKQINPDGTFRTHYYDDLGNCVAKIDELGCTTRFVYDSRNRLIQTIHPDGATERTRYDAVGNLIAAYDAAGAVTTFKFDVAGRLLESKLPDPVTGTTTAGSPTTTNTYDKLGNLIQTIDPERNVTQFKYDKLGRVLQSQVLDNVDGDRSPIAPLATFTQLVELTTTDYDAAGNVRRSAVFDVTKFDAAATPPLAADPRAQTTLAEIAANRVHVMATTYDAFGRPIEVVNADSTSSRIVYDAAGRALRAIDELGRMASSAYDALGRLAKTTLPDPDGPAALASPVTGYRYDGAGNLSAVTDPRGFIAHFQYDAYDRSSSTIDAAGGQSRTSYNAVGQTVVVADALGRAAFTLYDKRGRALLARSPDPDGSGPGLPSTTHRTYDAVGRLAQQIDPRGTIVDYQYDKLGRLRYERTTLAEIVDDGDAEFGGEFTSDTVHNPPADSSTGYSGDWRTVTTNGGWSAGVWTFENLPAGTYRIATTWTPNQAYDDYMSLQVTIDGGMPFYPAITPEGMHQRTAPSSIVRYDEGFARGWKLQSQSNVTIADADANADGLADLHTLRVILTPGSAPLNADAVRIERIITREFTYDANGNLLKEVDPIGHATASATDRTTTYGYDELDRVLTVNRAAPGTNGPNPAQVLSDQLTTYAYDGYGNRVSVLERRATGIFQRLDVSQFDLRNRLVVETRDVGVDTASPAVDYQNNRTQYVYDAAGNLLRTTELAETSAGVFTPLRHTTRTYDALDRVTKETFNDENDPLTTADDADDLVDSVNERVSVSEYDAAGNVLRVRQNPLGNAQQRSTTRLYDRLGRVIATSAAGGGELRTSRFLHDAAGQVVGTADALNRIARSEYDRLGRLTKSIAPDPDGPGAAAASTTTFTYDAGGNLLSETNGAGETDRYAFDSLGRQVGHKDGRGDVTKRRYDDAGNLIRLVDPAGNRTDSKYDGLDRLDREVVYGGANGTSPKLRSYVYDNFGNLVIVIDRNGLAVRYVSDRLDRVIEERWYASETDARNFSGVYSGVVETVYDDLGRVEERRLSHRSGGQVIDRVTDSYQYDALDRVLEHSNQSHAGAHSLEALGVPATPLVHTYEYLYVGAVVQENRRQWVAGVLEALTSTGVGPFGETNYIVDVDANYGAGAEFEGSATTLGYDKTGALAWMTRETDYDNAIGWRNQSYAGYGYDRAGRLASLDHYSRTRTTATWPGFTHLLGFDYGFDGADRIKTIATDWNTGLAGLTTRVDASETLVYDGAGQLGIVNSTNDAADAAYFLLANGNRQVIAEGGTEAEATTAYALPGPQNRLTADTNYTYVYDSEGNLTERKVAGTGAFDQKYFWDHRNRLTKAVIYAGGMIAKTIDYRYDAGGNLVRRSVTPAGGSATVEHFAVEGGERTLTHNATGKITRRYVHGPLGDVLIDQAFNAAGAELSTTTQLSDHQGSPRVLWGAAPHSSPAVRQSIDYAPFGRSTEVHDSAGQPTTAAVDAAFGHHGSLLDPETGLQVKGARWYSPTMGRFISVDPIHDGSNWYEAFGNDPVNYADPSGLSPSFHPLTGFAGGTLSTPRLGASSYAGISAPATSRGINVSSPILTQTLNSPRPSSTFLRELGPIASANQASAQKRQFKNVTTALQFAGKYASRPTGPVSTPLGRMVSDADNAFAWLGNQARANSNSLANGVEYVTGGYGGSVGNFVAGVGGGLANLVRTAGGVNASVDLPRTVSDTVQDFRQTLDVAQQYGFRTAAARELGLLQGAEAYYGTDVLSLGEIDRWAKASESAGRIGAAAGAAAGVAGRLSTRAARVGSQTLRYVDNGSDLAPTNYPNGTFSITKQKLETYPAGVAKPEGPFRLLDDAEYSSARRSADVSNNSLRAQYNLRGSGLDIHEIHPVKFGGSPTSLDNKVLLEQTYHRRVVTPWWNQLQREIERTR